MEKKITMQAADTKPRTYADGIPVYCAYDEILPIEQLRPNPKNPNTHPQEQLEMLGKIIRGNGWRNPITVSTRSGLIVKGHGRLLTAQLEELKEVPVEFQNYDSDEAELADLTADNRIAELAEIDTKMLADVFADIDTGAIDFELSGYTEDEYKDIATALSEAVHNELENPDEIPETPDPENTVTESGDLWLLGQHRLLCGDSTKKEDVELLMDGHKADMVMTDPPYGINAESMTMGSGKKDFHRGKDWDKERPDIKMVFDIAPLVCIWGGNYFSDQLPITNDWLIWHKKNDGLSFSECELAWTNFGINCRHISHHWGNEKKEHVTMKPLDVITWAIEKAKAKANLIVDLFGGSGTTLIASEQLGRSCYTMELDPKYCDVIVKRYIRTTGSKNVKCIRNGEELPREMIADIFNE